jgi:ABC-type branched-subunit amino acid transport system substrate-binding protein
LGKNGMTGPLSRAAIGIVLGVWCAACVETRDGDDEDAIVIGAILPFTGDIAATGTNIERALQMVIEQVNDAGGIAGKPLRLMSRDCHSEVKRGLNAAYELLEDKRLLGIIGPENDDLALQLVQLVRGAKVVGISGGVTSPMYTTAVDDGFCFRTCPSALVHSRALAERMEQDGVTKAAIMTISNEFGTGMSGMLVNELVARNIQVPSPTSFAPDQHTYADMLRAVLKNNPEAIALVAYPKTGATIIQDWGILGGQNRWYLAPSLKNTVFIDNVPPGALNGAIGTAPTVAADRQVFAEAFSERWEGDQPLDAAYFYYDAAAVMALAMAAAAQRAARVPTGTEVRDQVTAVSTAPGDRVTWKEISRGLDLLKSGKDIDYTGASGPVELDANGDIAQGQVELWTIKQDKIVSLGTGS